MLTFSLSILAFEVRFLCRVIIVASQPVVITPGAEDESGSAMGFLFLVFAMIWSVINIIPAAITFFLTRKGKCPFGLFIVSTVLQSIKIACALLLLIQLGGVGAMISHAYDHW